MKKGREGMSLAPLALRSRYLMLYFLVEDFVWPFIVATAWTDPVPFFAVVTLDGCENVHFTWPPLPAVPLCFDFFLLGYVTVIFTEAPGSVVTVTFCFEPALTDLLASRRLIVRGTTVFVGVGAGVDVAVGLGAGVGVFVPKLGGGGGGGIAGTPVLLGAGGGVTRVAVALTAVPVAVGVAVA
jgi:hypothetical protein